MSALDTPVLGNPLVKKLHATADAITCYASTITEYPPNAVADLLRRAAAKIEADEAYHSAHSMHVLVEMGEYEKMIGLLRKLIADKPGDRGIAETIEFLRELAERGDA